MMSGMQDDCRGLSRQLRRPASAASAASAAGGLVLPALESMRASAATSADGSGLLRMYEGGYMANFYKSCGALARQWSQNSGGGFLGLYPAYTLGTLADRNHVASRNFFAFTPPRRRW